MTTETDWSHDYCLFCDKQTMGGLYCSQACRLADLETHECALESPSALFSDSESWTFSPSTYDIQRFSSKSSGNFQLPPPFDFDKYRASSSGRLESPPLSPRTAPSMSEQSQRGGNQSRPSVTKGKTTNYVYTQTQTRSLNPSSSRSSLSSIASTGSTQGLSEQAISQLQNYSNSFDHTRDWKRRVTFG
jgi:hypothetical protein